MCKARKFTRSMTSLKAPSTHVHNCCIDYYWMLMIGIVYMIANWRMKCTRLFLVWTHLAKAIFYDLEIVCKRYDTIKQNAYVAVHTNKVKSSITCVLLDCVLRISGTLLQSLFGFGFFEFSYTCGFLINVNCLNY